MNLITNTIRFILDDQVREINFDRLDCKPSTTVLNYLRSLDNHKGVKEGCAEGDCGACTVVVAEPGPFGKLVYKAMDSCLLFLPMIHGKQLITIENLTDKRGNEPKLHPVQQALVEFNGTQCGYCTPGMLMSMFNLYKNEVELTEAEVRQALAGNLCRCTGYHSILEATLAACRNKTRDHFSEKEDSVLKQLSVIEKDTNPLVLKSRDQQYLLPFTLEDALVFRASFPEAVIVNGASDVALRQNKQHEYFPVILDLSHVDELKIYYEDHHQWFIGSGISLEELKEISRERIPSLFDVLSVFASLQVRNTATLGGNIATASPIGDTLPWLMVMEANVHLKNPDGDRFIPVNEFITAYRHTAISKKELITLITVSKPAETEKIRFYKISNRKDVDITSVSGAFRLNIRNGLVEMIKIALGGMAATPVRAKQTEAFLSGKPWSREVIDAASLLLQQEFQPISDARSDAESRRLAAGNLLLKCWNEVV